MTRAPIIMGTVAAVAALGGAGVLVGIRGSSEGAVYARRIGATMLLMLALILGGFATAMASWGAA
ncbi:hypothetical protein [Sphingomonas sp.]|jgi:hypothetical protein|uniref:hypothetical protein n=1 Tax=Sphingomonas sp. TaxID=28214 RepID=UPI002E308E66|nr:hypothetical protein [Sphingomonas sp.]HEX4694931.1 hypothetical protein [Sphingomonas sp.]